MVNQRLMLICILAIILLSGCAQKTWKAPWTEALPPTPSEQSSRLFEVAMGKYNAANSKRTLLESIDAFEAVLGVDPGSKQALSTLSNQYILLGTAYTEDRHEKMAYFHRAIKYSELAMYTNSAFKKAVDSGQKPWEAAETLQADDAPAMLFWVTALQYEFKETMALPGKIINVNWMNHGLIFLDRITAVAPEFGHGAVEFAYTINYCVLPESMGGDPKKCQRYMDESIAKSSGYLLPRWGRGKYFHQVSGDIETSRKDLKWVAAQDLTRYKDAYPWRVHFVHDAGEQLEILKEQ